MKSDCSYITSLTVLHLQGADPNTSDLRSCGPSLVVSIGYLTHNCSKICLEKPILQVQASRAWALCLCISSPDMIVSQRVKRIANAGPGCSAGLCSGIATGTAFTGTGMLNMAENALGSEDLYTWHSQVQRADSQDAGRFTSPELSVSVTRLLPALKVMSQGWLRCPCTEQWCDTHAHTLSICGFPDKSRCNSVIPTFMKRFEFYIWKAFNRYLSVIASNLRGIQKAAYFSGIFAKSFMAESSRLQ